MISSREKFGGPACPVNVLIPWFPCSCRDLHPPIAQWHTVTHWLRSVSVAEAVSRFKEKVGTHFSKIQNWRSQGEMMIFRCWCSFGGFGHRPMPLCNHTWPSILKRRSLTRTLGPTGDPLSSSTVSASGAGPPRAGHQTSKGVVFTFFTSSQVRSECGDLDHFLRSFFWNNLRKNTKKIQKDVWTLLTFASSSCTGPWWAQHLCEARNRAPETHLFH